MKRSTATRIPGRPSRGRSRFGYDRFWRSVAAPSALEHDVSYWFQTRRPIPSLIFILPLIAAYEIGVATIGGTSADALRTGADSWMRGALSRIGLRDRWLPPLALVASMLAWQVFRSESWRFRPRCLLGMLGESLIFAVALVGLSRVVELGFAKLDGGSLLETSSRLSLATVVGYVGAGVYEEALFRLALIPLLYGAARLIHAPKVLAGTLAVTASALLFSLAHHAGAPGEAFTLFAFIFRWMAGIGFGWIFLARGFGVAVGTHAAYDVLVGWVGLHF